MPEIERYHLIAYDVDTGRLAFEWRNCAATLDLKKGFVAFDTEREADTIDHDGTKWKFMGIRQDTNAPETIRIDVKRLTG
jgi:hypothetical protein